MPAVGASAGARVVQGAAVSGVPHEVAIGLHGAKRAGVALGARVSAHGTVREAVRHHVAVALHIHPVLAVGRLQVLTGREPLVGSQDTLAGSSGGSGSRRTLAWSSWWPGRPAARWKKAFSALV